MCNSFVIFPVRVLPPAGHVRDNRKRVRTDYMPTGPLSRRHRACRLALGSGPAAVGAGISAGAFFVRHVVDQTADSNIAVGVVEEGLRQYEVASAARRVASDSAARMSTIL